jgi:hypothetical protein
MWGSEAGTKVLLLGGHTDKPCADKLFIDLSSPMTPIPILLWI